MTPEQREAKRARDRERWHRIKHTRSPLTDQQREAKRAKDRRRTYTPEQRADKTERERWRRVTVNFYRLLRLLDDPNTPPMRELAQKAGLT